MKKRYIAIAGGIAVLDILAKMWVRHHLAMEVDTVVVARHFFNIILTENRGIIFGILNNKPPNIQEAILLGLGAVMMAVVLGFMTTLPRNRITLTGVALALILGGAASNLVDRAVYGAVTDYLDFYFRTHHWHTFNVGDSAIVCGVAFIVLDMIRPMPVQRESRRKSRSSRVT